MPHQKRRLLTGRKHATVRLCAVFLASILVSASLLRPSTAEQVIDRSDLSSIFDRHGVQGTFVMFAPTLEHLTLVDSKRAATRFIPASTFKIANSLVALETGTVADENEILPFGGRPQPIKVWEQDMSMRDAIRVSNVPVYQGIATRVGRARYEDWLTRLDYGNTSVGSEVQTFWLRGPLKISAIEQARFLARLAQEKLPMSVRSQSAVIDILMLEEEGGKTLFGKTGWTTTPDPDIGWFVGWVNTGTALHTFALNIDIRDRQDVKLRKTIALEFLSNLGVFGD